MSYLSMPGESDFQNSLPIEAVWSFDDIEENHEITLRLAEYGVHQIALLDRDGERIVTTGLLEVDPRVRGKRIGTRLLRAGLALAQDRGATVSRAHVESPYALMIRERIFGADGIQIYDNKASSTTPLPLTVSQACDSLERVINIVGVPDSIDHGFVVISDLKDLDTSTWERPLERNTPHTPLAPVEVL